jgi:hypothetical protein
MKVIPLSGSPEGRANMARWLERRLGYPEGALDDGPVTPFEEMPDTPLKRLALLVSKDAKEPVDFAYYPEKK